MKGALVAVILGLTTTYVSSADGDEKRDCSPYWQQMDPLASTYVSLGTGNNCRSNLFETLFFGDDDVGQKIGRICHQQNPYLKCFEVFTLQQCEAECDKDPKCMGFEYGHTALECILIDSSQDIIPDGEGSVECFKKDLDLQQFVNELGETGELIRPACNKRFKGSDLSEDMLQCHCYDELSHETIANPGTIDRTVQMRIDPKNAKFCEEKRVDCSTKRSRQDLCYHNEEKQIKFEKEQTEKVRNAIANRMFHFCRSWCLFDAETPDKVFWLWNNVDNCYKQQKGENAYCNTNHVVSNSIEFQFIKKRATEFCDIKEMPEPTPEPLEVYWEFSDNHKQDCHQVCEMQFMKCRKEEFGLVQNEMLDFPSIVKPFFNEAIKSYAARFPKKNVTDWKCQYLNDGIQQNNDYNPTYHRRSKRCILRDGNSKAKNGDACKGKAKGGFKRMCPCVKTE